MATTLLENCRLAPPPGAVADQSLPLTFFDITWLFFHPILQLLFYEFPCSKPHFLEILLPKLKESLSLTLRHFFPLSGRIVYPLGPGRKPVIRYRAGDSVSVTVFESGDDFDDVVGDHPRDAAKFYDYVPKMPATVNEDDDKLIHVLAIRVTLFPGRGVCIGTAVHHSVADAVAVVGFLKSWALINKSKILDPSVFHHDDSLISKTQYSPLHDRSLVNYPQELDFIYWDRIRKIPLPPPSYPIPTNRVRATFVFTQSQINNLKTLIQSTLPRLPHLSSFVAVSAHIWTSFAKSLQSSTKIADEEPEFFSFGVDLRARLKPPVPRNYFGNCISYGLPKLLHKDLVGEDGFFAAAEAIAEEIKRRVIDKEDALEDVGKWWGEIGPAMRKSHVSVSGSERFELYSADFGWGNARKMEIVSIDEEKYAVSLCRAAEGGLEVGLSLPAVVMDAFAALVYEGVEEDE